MTKQKHTDGPWEYHNGDDYTVILGPGDTTDRPLAEVYSDRLADAKLIAAAPDLLDALKAVMLLRSLFDASDCTPDDALHILANQPTTWEKVHAALSKAGA
jgi:hypothetical protein